MKNKAMKLLSIMLAVVMLAGMIPTMGITLTSSGDTAYLIVKGDADSSGKLTVSDYLRIKRHFMEVYSLAGVNLEAADVNGDGIIGTDDYLAIKVHFKNGIIINSSFTNSNLVDDTPVTTGYDLPFIPI